MSVAEIRRISRIEKLRLVEVLWDEIARDDRDFESPAWHEAELRKTEGAVAEEALDWAEAKKRLWEMFE